MFDGGPDLAQRRVELDLVGVEVDAGESLVRDGVDSLDADIAQIGHRGVVGESLGQPGCGEGVRVVAGGGGPGPGARRAPCTGTGPTAASWPSRVAAICRFMPGYPVLAENRSGTWCQSQVGHTVPSTSTVPRPTTSRGSGTPSARASPISGRSRSQRRLTVAWLTPNTAPAKSWVTFLRIRHTTRATDRNSPSASGGPVETNLSPHNSCSRATRSVSCSLFSPVIASYRNSSSPILARCLRTPNKTGRAVAPQARHAPVSISRSSRELPPRCCG